MSNQILVVYSHQLCATNAQVCLACKTPKEFVDLWCLLFSFGSVQSFFLYQRFYLIEVKFLCSYQLYVLV